MKDKFGRYVFRPAVTLHSPTIVGRGRGGDPVYSVLREDGVRACRDYYNEALDFLSGASNSPPSLGAVTSAAVPHGSILKVAVADGTVELDPFGPKALVSIEDADRFSEILSRSPRWLDPEYIPAILMLTAPGGSLRFNDSRSKRDKDGAPTAAGKRRFFIAFGRRQDQNIRLLRIITNAPKGSQVHRLTVDMESNYHYDYRKNALGLKRDETVIRAGLPAGYSDKGRSAAIRAAGEHFERAAKKHGKAALQHVSSSRAAFEKMLRHYFEVADRLHAEQTHRRKLAR